MTRWVCGVGSAFHFDRVSADHQGVKFQPYSVCISSVHLSFSGSSDGRHRNHFYVGSHFLRCFLSSSLQVYRSSLLWLETMRLPPGGGGRRLLSSASRLQAATGKQKKASIIFTKAPNYPFQLAFGSMRAAHACSWHLPKIATSSFGPSLKMPMSLAVVLGAGFVAFTMSLWVICSYLVHRLRSFFWNDDLELYCLESMLFMLFCRLSSVSHVHRFDPELSKSWLKAENAGNKRAVVPLAHPGWPPRGHF